MCSMLQPMVGWSGIVFGLLAFDACQLWANNRSVIFLAVPLWVLIRTHLKVPHSAWSEHIAGLVSGFTLFCVWPTLSRVLPAEVVLVTAAIAMVAAFWKMNRTYEETVIRF